MAKVAFLFALLLAFPAQAETVVFLPGLGDGKGSFAALARKLPDDVAFHNEVMPHSLPGDEDGRNPYDASRELHDRLVAKGLAGPFILVGHSLGGPEALTFAALYPDETAGVVLVDPRLPGFSTRCQAAGLAGCTLPTVVQNLLPQGQIALLEGVEQLPDAVVWARDLPNLPVVLFSAGRPPVGLGKEFATLWQQMHADFVAALPNGTLIPMTKSRHYIHKEKPQLVLDEILRLSRTGG